MRLKTPRVTILTETANRMMPLSGQHLGECSGVLGAASYLQPMRAEA